MRATAKEEHISELSLPQWSVISFDRLESSGLDYNTAAQKLTELEANGVNGLCIVTDEAARRMRNEH